MAAKFEIFEDAKGEHRFRLRAPNGEPVLQSEGYSSEQKAREGIEAIKEHAPSAQVVDADE